jgi:U2 small nuclear ribonucleoprotein A'
MMQKLPALEMLVLNNNPLSTVETLRVLQGGKVRYLSLIDCPVTRTPHYRLNVIAMLPQLKALDFCKITAAERQAAAELTTTDTAVVEERPSKVSKVDKERIKERLREAKSLDEIKQLERILDTGHVPDI